MQASSSTKTVYETVNNVIQNCEGDHPLTAMFVMAIRSGLSIRETVNPVWLKQCWIRVC